MLEEGENQKMVTLPERRHGICPNTGWVDPPIWGRMSGPTRWKTFGLVQGLLWGTTDDGGDSQMSPWNNYDEWEAAHEETWHQWRKVNAHEEEPDSLETSVAKLKKDTHETWDIVMSLWQRLDDNHDDFGTLKDKIDKMQGQLERVGTEGYYSDQKLNEKIDKL